VANVEDLSLVDEQSFMYDKQGLPVTESLFLGVGLLKDLDWNGSCRE